MAKVKRFNKETGKTELVEQTPEEVATMKSQQSAGAEYIKAREKALSQGATKEQANAATLPGYEPDKTLTSNQQVTLQQSQQALAIQQAQLNQMPDKSNIMPSEKTNAIPFVGNIKEALSVKPFAQGSNVNNVVTTPGASRSQSLAEIQSQVQERGLTTSESIGALIEASFAGKLNRYLGIFSTPGKKIEDLANAISSYASNIADDTTLVSQGLMSPQLAASNIAKAEKDIDVTEAQIKQLTIVSAELRANPEQIILIQEKINDARDAILISRKQLGII